MTRVMSHVGHVAAAEFTVRPPTAPLADLPPFPTAVSGRHLVGDSTDGASQTEAGVSGADVSAHPSLPEAVPRDSGAHVGSAGAEGGIR